MGQKELRKLPKRKGKKRGKGGEKKNKGGRVEEKGGS